MSNDSMQLPPDQQTGADTYGRVVINADEFPALAELVEWGSDIDAYLERVGVSNSDLESGPDLESGSGLVT